MQKKQTLSNSEWQLMELLWHHPRTLMELVGELDTRVGWSKSTVATMVRRLEEKGLIGYVEQGRAKLFHANISHDDAAVGETQSLLQRAYNGSLGLLVSAMARKNSLTKADIDELYAILKKAEEDAK